MNIFYGRRVIKSPIVGSILFVVVVDNDKSPLRKYNMYGSNRKSSKRILAKNYGKRLYYFQEDHLVQIEWIYSHKTICFKYK